MSDTMVSRSLRIQPATLKVLQVEADNQGMGITVYIRSVLEQHAWSLIESGNKRAKDCVDQEASGTLF